MHTAVIIDDEEKGRFALRQKLIDYCPNVQVLAEAENGKQGLEVINMHNPHIVFLDIEMPEMNGFEMLMRLPEKKFQIIFTTAYDHYAIKAIKYAAFDYLLKPIDIDELKTTIERVSLQTDSNVTTEKLDVLQKNLLSKPFLNKIAIPTNDGLLFFDISTIINLEAQSNYTMIYFKDHPKLMASRTLKEFEEILPADTFFRTHNSHIINLNFIKRYLRGDGGQVEMTNGCYVIVSRSRKDEFLKMIGR